MTIAPNTYRASMKLTKENICMNTEKVFFLFGYSIKEHFVVLSGQELKFVTVFYVESGKAER